MIIEPYTWRSVEITRIDRVSSDTIAVRTKKPDGFAFRAGQYTVIRVTTTSGQMLVRQYSFSSSPDDDWLEFTIQKEPGGEVTSWFHEQATVGAAIEISQAFGHFTFDNTTGRPLIFVAGRVGIAPYMSYLRQATISNNVRITYSVREPDQVCFWDELKPMTELFVTREGKRISRADLEPYAQAYPVVYLCGSRQFVEAMQHHFAALGIPPEDIRRELFTL